MFVSGTGFPLASRTSISTKNGSGRTTKVVIDVSDGANVTQACKTIGVPIVKKPLLGVLLTFVAVLADPAKPADSQASPIPLWLRSAWSGLRTSGQLS